MFFFYFHPIKINGTLTINSQVFLGKSTDTFFFDSALKEIIETVILLSTIWINIFLLYQYFSNLDLNSTITVI